jgi:hypothetical protein
MNWPAEEIIAQSFDRATMRRVPQLARAADRQAALVPESNVARVRHGVTYANGTAGIETI